MQLLNLKINQNFIFNNSNYSKKVQIQKIKYLIKVLPNLVKFRERKVKK